MNASVNQLLHVCVLTAAAVVLPFIHLTFGHWTFVAQVVENSLTIFVCAGLHPDAMLFQYLDLFRREAACSRHPYNGHQQRCGGYEDESPFEAHCVQRHD